MLGRTTAVTSSVGSGVTRTNIIVKAKRSISPTSTLRNMASCLIAFASGVCQRLGGEPVGIASLQGPFREGRKFYRGGSQQIPGSSTVVHSAVTVTIECGTPHSYTVPNTGVGPITVN